MEEKHHPKKNDPLLISYKKSTKEIIKSHLVTFFSNKYNLMFLLVLVLTLYTRLKFFNMESIWNDAAVHLWYAIKVTKEPLFFFSKQYLLGDYVIP